MAKVQLSDVVNKTVFMDLAAEAKPEKTAFFQSGVVVRDPLADGLAEQDGQDGVLPFWLDLDPSGEPNYSDDTATTATPKKVSQSQQKTRKSHLNQGWSATDLARELQMGTDAMRHIRNRIDTYWARSWQRRVVAATKGIFNANVAGRVTSDGSAGDMVVDIAIEDGNNAAAANLFSRSAFTQSVFTLGDFADSLSAILVHSVIMKRMVDQDDIDYIRDRDGVTMIPTYLGHRIIVDDGAPVVAGVTSGFKYISTLYGAAAFAYGEAQPTVPMEIDRSPEAGNGGGEETIWSRKTWLIHPVGHSNTGTNVNGNTFSQNLSDLALATSWDRTHFRKNVPVAFLVTNG